jgi:hypothetical protein
LSASTVSLHVARLRRFTTMPNPTQISTFAPLLRVQCNRHVRFTPESGHVRCNSRCLLWTNSQYRKWNSGSHIAVELRWKLDSRTAVDNTHK